MEPSTFLCFFLLFCGLFSRGEYAAANFCSPRLGNGDLMCVNICGGCGICVAQFACCGYKVNTICNHRRCCGMSECVGVNVGQIMPLTEFPEPAGDAVRIHHSSIVMGEDEIGSHPTITVQKAEPKLFCVPLVEKLQTLGRKHYCSGLTSLGFPFICALGGRVPCHTDAISSPSSSPIRWKEAV